MDNIQIISAMVSLFSISSVYYTCLVVSKNEKLVIGLMFFIFFAIFAPNGHYPSDTHYSVSTASAIVSNGSFQIDSTEKTPFPVKSYSGGLYSKYGVGYSFVFVPLAVVSILLESVLGIDSELVMRGLASLTNTVFAALFVVVFYIFALMLGFAPKVAFISSLLLAVGSILLPYSKIVLVETPTAILLILSLHLVFKEGKDGYSLLLLGFSLAGLLLLKVANVIYLPVLILFALSENGCLKKKDVRQILLIVVPILVALFTVLVLNKVRFGSLLEFGYGDETKEFTGSFINGLIGFLFSPSKSIFFYSPIVILSIIGMPAFFKKHKSVFAVILILFTVSLFFHAKWHSWYGGWSWGPRLIVPVLLLLHIPILSFIEALQKKRFYKAVLFFVVIPSIAVQLLGSLVLYQQTHYFIKDPSSLTAPHFAVSAMLLKHKLSGKEEIYSHSNGLTLDFRERETYNGLANLWSYIARESGHKLVILLPFGLSVIVFAFALKRIRKNLTI